MSLIERVARAMAGADGYDFDRLASEDTVTTPRMLSKGHWTKHARAVLQEIREPDGAMDEAGGFVTSSANPTRWNVMRSDDKKFHREFAVDVWQAMIDAALSDQ